MSKSLCLFALVALMAVVSAGYPLPLCEGNTECSASVSIIGSSRGVGNCIFRSRASCSATQQAENCFAFDSDSLGDECVTGTAEADASCFATAAATAITSAFTSGRCDDVGGIICAEAEADAEAIACALAHAVIDVTIGGANVTPECEIELEKIVDAVAGAVSNSQAGICITDDNPIDWDADFQFSSAEQTAFARAFGTCFKYCDDGVLVIDAIGGVEGDTTDLITGNGCVGIDCLDR